MSSFTSTAKVVYFASPFFNPEQIERERRLVGILREQGFIVFAPSESGTLKPDADEAERNKIFAENVRMITRADIVFVVTDGKDIGTIWESGFACGLNEYHRRFNNSNTEFIEKTIVYYCETLGDNPFNVMLAKSGHMVLTNEQQARQLAAYILNGMEVKHVGKIQ